MFEITNEILVLYTRKNNYSVYKLKLDAASKQKYVRLFNEGIDNLFCDWENEERTSVPFTSNYKLSEDECFLTSNFKMLSCVKEAIDTPDTLEAFIPQNVQGNAPNGYKIKAILIGRKTENGTYVIAGQKFSKSQIL